MGDLHLDEITQFYLLFAPHLRRWGCTVSRNCFNLNILIIKLHNPYTHCLSSRSFPSYDIFFVCIMQLTLHVCQSEWPKDKPFLLMHSRHARNLYNSKIKIIFEIAWTLFEIILFIHLDRARSTLWKKICGLLFTTSNEYIWPQKNLIFMPRLKSAILAIFQKDWYGTF